MLFRRLWYLLLLLVFYVFINIHFSTRNLNPDQSSISESRFHTNSSYEPKQYNEQFDNDDVVFLIITGKPNQDDRIPLQQQTWMRYTTQTYIFSETASGRLPLIVLPNITDSYASNGPKFWDALQWAWERFQNRAKWFAKVDDDTFVNVHEIYKLLKQKDARKFTVYGRCGEHFLPETHVSQETLPRNWTFVDGGAGTFISSYAMSLLNLHGFLNKSKVLERHGSTLFGFQDASFGEIIAEIARRETLRYNRTFTSPFICEDLRLQHQCDPKHPEAKFCLRHRCTTLHRCRKDLMLFWHRHFSARRLRT
ncbi:unnamed protein product [Adineta steineri]|uniref:N-acetylgalactosaminide beta-1,3-galactosyltransferase n=2 Tax=Adineta steineri TaxID=433720 RepID=A0A815CKS7_9BILA|nr:unnamed protein product [Adineta steineri]CAF1345018.1 unnamed protein product [Adineta steineri]CAF3808551.1 unnamed protein product [Adineta steineri]